MMESVPRVLCLDIEGGYGGSSRSLYEFVRCLRNKVSIEVWCRRAGPIEDRYAAIGVPCSVATDMPKVSSLPRCSRNLLVYSQAYWSFWKARPFLVHLLRTVNNRFDLVHFNHEALFLLASWLRRRTNVPFTMHIRTNLWDTSFARWQTRKMSRAVNHFAFITENEQRNFQRLGGWGEGTVIYNIAEPTEACITPLEAVPKDHRFKIASLSNYSWLRGSDRLVNVAVALAAQGRRDFLFVVAGDIKLPRSLPGELGKVARRGGTLADYASVCGVLDMFLFLGHVSEPESVLAACHVMAKLTREDNPWGRDIIEALAAGRPVLSIGRWDGFVQNGRTGVLYPVFQADGVAQGLIQLADDRGRLNEMAGRAREHVTRLCSGRERAADLLAIWAKLVRA